MLYNSAKKVKRDTEILMTVKNLFPFQRRRALLRGNLTPNTYFNISAKTKGNDWVRRVAKKHPENHCDTITCGAQFTLHLAQPGLLLNITVNLNPHTYTLHAICNCHLLHPQAIVIRSSLSHKCGRNSWHQITYKNQWWTGNTAKTIEFWFI